MKQKETAERRYRALEALTQRNKQEILFYLEVLAKIYSTSFHNGERLSLLDAYWLEFDAYLSKFKNFESVLLLQKKELHFLQQHAIDPITVIELEELTIQRSYTLLANCFANTKNNFQMQLDAIQVPIL